MATQHVQAVHLSLLFLLSLHFLPSTILGEAARNYVAARGQLLCANRAFQGTVQLLNIPRGKFVWQWGRAILDQVHTDPEGSFELLGENNNKDRPDLPFSPIILIKYKCSEGTEAKEDWDKADWEKQLYIREQADQQWMVQDLGEQLQAVNRTRDEREHQWAVKLSTKVSSPPEPSVDDNSNNTLKIYLPEVYWSAEPIPERFFELGRLNLIGLIKREKKDWEI